MPGQDLYFPDIDQYRQLHFPGEHTFHPAFLPPVAFYIFHNHSDFHPEEPGNWHIPVPEPWAQPR